MLSKEEIECIEDKIEKLIKKNKKLYKDNGSFANTKDEKENKKREENEKKWYKNREKMMILKKKLNEEYDKKITNRKKEEIFTETTETFVNNFGEATTRYVTSTTYEKAQKRLEKQVLNNLL